MNIRLKASITTARRVYSQSAAKPAPIAPIVPKRFNSYTAQPGDIVMSNWSGKPDISTVQNTPEERKQLRNAIASYLPKFHFWTGYVGDINRKFGVNHYWEIPSDKIPEALEAVENLFKEVPLFPSYSQSPAPAVQSEAQDAARWELEAALNQFETYRKWFKEQSDLMDYAINSVKATLAAIQ